jgi:RND superfamily putative drug exporter
MNHLTPPQTGIDTAVFLDAFVISSVLLPAILERLGRRTWTLPSWLDRRLRRIASNRGLSRDAPEVRHRSRTPSVEPTKG